jgi:hypothetical protein
MPDDEPSVELPPLAEPEVRIWSPLAVGIYALVLAYPCALAIAIRNWKALDQKNRIWPHVLGAAVVTLPLVVLLFTHPRLGRYFSLGVNVSTFAYLREKLRSDVAEFKRMHPSAIVSTRPWYSAIGWALLAILVFMFLAIAFGLMLDVFGIGE